MSGVDVRGWTIPELEHAVRDALRRAAAVLALHLPHCGACGGPSACCECGAEWPCPTVRALGVTS